MNFQPQERVILLHNIPLHEAGEQGRVHDHHHHWIGVRFDSSPTDVRYVEPIDLAYPTPTSDEAVETLELDRATRVAFWAIADNEADDRGMNRPCSYPHGCDQIAVWWYEHHCGHIVYACEPHRATDDHRTAISVSRGRRIVCDSCRQNTPNPTPWRAL